MVDSHIVWFDRRNLLPSNLGEPRLRKCPAEPCKVGSEATLPAGILLIGWNTDSSTTNILRLRRYSDDGLHFRV